jgi:hypothetical protein
MAEDKTGGMVGRFRGTRAGDDFIEETGGRFLASQGGAKFVFKLVHLVTPFRSRSGKTVRVRRQGAPHPSAVWRSGEGRSQPPRDFL